MAEKKSLAQRISLALGPYCSEEFAGSLQHLDNTTILSLEESQLSSAAADLSQIIEEIVIKGDMVRLAEVMSSINEEFNGEQFLAATLDSNGELSFGLEDGGYRDMVAEIAKEEVDIESISMQYFFNEDSGMDPEAGMLAAMEEEILAEIIEDPSGNRHLYLEVPSEREWVFEQHRENILPSWKAAGGMESLLDLPLSNDNFLEIITSG